MADQQPSPSQVIIACDATKDRHERELKLIVNGIRMRGDILRGGNTLIVFGVLHRVRHPMGYQTQAGSSSFAGTSSRAMEEEVSKKVDSYLNLLLQSAEDCEIEGVKIEVKITAGAPLKKVIVQEALACKATWIILDRHLRRDLDYYHKHIPLKVALVQENLSVEVSRPYATKETTLSIPEHKVFYSLSKPVPVLDLLDHEIVEHSSMSLRSFSVSTRSSGSSDVKHSIASATSNKELESNTLANSMASSLKLDKTASFKGENKTHTAMEYFQRQRKPMFRRKSTGAPIVCATCGMKTELYIKDSMRFSYSEIQQATNDFSKDNLLGEGGYGHVYKGELRDGQIIAAKVHKEASEQGFEEFNSEVFVLSFARHRNIVMLLGYCCKEKHNILVYEFICNNSLHWHLYDESASVLEWHHRHAIAVATAKGLRFLHEECRGGPIIHRDVRPSNILLTHDFVPMVCFMSVRGDDVLDVTYLMAIGQYISVTKMGLESQMDRILILGDFGLAKWKTGGDDTQHTRILGTLGYLAPEYAESGIVSVRTDVYAFGIVLLQLITGRRVLAANEESQTIRQWGIPLIEKLALHELIDARVGDSYDTLQLYIMAKTAYLCMQTDPELRPSMGEVLRLLEGESDHFQHITEHFIPQYM